jgi:acetyl-CoA carboxylase alpha subunit
LKLGVADELVPEPPDGAHTDFPGTAAALKEVLKRNLDALAGMSGSELVERRYARFRAFGSFSNGVEEQR